MSLPVSLAVAVKNLALPLAVRGGEILLVALVIAGVLWTRRRKDRKHFRGQ